MQRLLGRVPRSAYLLVVFAIVYAATVSVARGIVVRLEQENERVRRQVTELQGIEVTAVFGEPPVPIRPGHVSRLGGVYYRGNCERNPSLYNYGNYQTAIMTLALCGPDKQPLARGDRIDPHPQLWIRLEIERAPFAAAQLFTRSIMEQVFLSDQYLRAGDERTSPMAPLEVVEHGEHWSACWPVPAALPAEGRLQGLVYVHREAGGAESPPVPHYGISYDLALAGGAISQDSELWMAPLYVPAQVIQPSRNKLPLCEWFDDRPLPVIVGGNTNDPKLLGVEDHLGQGERRQPPEPATPQQPAPGPR